MNKRKFIKIFIYILIAMVVIVMQSINLHLRAEDSPLPEDPKSTYNIQSYDKFVEYSRAYARGGRNPDDTIRLAMFTEGANWTLPGGDNGYIGLGTSARPFNGKIIITNASSNKFYLESPLFNYITTDAKIVDENDNTRTIILIRTRSGSNNIFAANIVAGSETNNLNLSIITSYIDNGTDDEVEDTGPLIGTMHDGCNVNIDFTNNAITPSGVKSNINASGNAGLIVGTVGDNCVVNVTNLAGTNNDINITSNSGSAGGIVGALDKSTLTLPSSYTCNNNVIANNGYAGGIVGSSHNGNISSQDSTIITLSKNITGKTGAGGLYGYYLADTNDKTFDLNIIDSDNNLIINSVNDSGSFGGVIGFLDCDNVNVTITDSRITDVSADSTFNRKVKFNSKNNNEYIGGLVGKYDNTNLSKTLYLLNNKVNILESNSTKLGGAIGKINDNSVYIKVDGFRLKSDTSLIINAGVIDKIETDEAGTGSFIDFYNDIVISGHVNSGLINIHKNGVIRLRGTTDLSGIANDNNAAQLVNDRNNCLIYALGSGADSGWKFIRGNQRADDVGSWGEVLRISSSYNGLFESSFFTVDETNHTVTVSAYKNSIGSITDFIKTALNIQLNNGSDYGALKFSDKTNNKSVILSSTLSITNNIDLHNTGIISLMRDNYDMTNGCECFTGTINGNNKTIKLAIGESYGCNSSGVIQTEANNGNNNFGTIIKHQHLGLVNVSAGGTFNNLTIDGYIISRCFAEKNIVGGLIAYLYTGNKDLSISNINSDLDITLYNNSGNNGQITEGGLIGYVSSGFGNTITIENSKLNEIINEKKSSGTSYISHGIGYIEANNELEVTFDDIELTGQYDNTYNSATVFSGMNYGGLISRISNKCEVNVTDLLVKDSYNLKMRVSANGATRSAGVGGIIGGNWNNVTTNIGTKESTEGITIGESTGPSIEVVSGSNNPNIGVLFYKATGVMMVNHVNVVKLNVKANQSSTFGFIVNDASNTDNSLYLNVYSDNYNIANTTITGTISKYDEIVAFSHTKDEEIIKNGQAIISIRTSGGANVIMDGTNCNTYQNQIASFKTRTNEDTRYYYNIDDIVNKAGLNDAEKLLIWSVKTYAKDNIKGNFNNGFTGKITGNCDMNGYSYYPVVASGMNVGDGSTNTIIKFYNNEIENSESGTGNSDSNARSTRNNTQHYLMHNGLFLNYTGALNVNNVKFSGNVSNFNNGSGMLVCGNIGGINNKTEVTIKNVELNGAEVIGTGYAPLLINRIRYNTSLSIDGLSQSGYSSGTHASSLIGEVGSTTDINIKLNFKDIKLDSRNGDSIDSTADSNMTSAYYTSRSIFTRATLLESFQYSRGGSAYYNFTKEDDWNNNSHNVTYGKEITDSVEFSNRQKKYYNDDDNFVNPKTNACDEFLFSEGFLPYVYDSYDLSNYKHEIRVNVKDATEIEGCGKYNHPFEIKNNISLEYIARILNGTTTDISQDATITLPNPLSGDFDSDTPTHYIYQFNGTQFVSSGGNKSLDEVRKYLAKAYYSIENDITLSNDFIGLSYFNSSVGFDTQYAFRGVIVGNGNTITNLTSNPLIANSNGSVIRDLEIKVGSSETNVNINLTVSSSIGHDYNYNTCPAYGAIIGKVFGGDNIIDKVAVDFTYAAFGGLTGNFARLIPIGGYIGVVVTGGVIFREMDDEHIISDERAGIPSSKLDKVGLEDWLYINPIIGRVINGYAFTESSSYQYEEANVTMKNGSKNYGIPDLNPNSSNKLTVTATAANNHVITIPDGQALYILQCIVNSGAGGAQYNANTAQKYSVSVSTSSTAGSAYTQYTATHCAKYNEVGVGASSTGDYANVSNDQFDTLAKIPYIIRQYTNQSGSVFHARSICGNGGNAAVSEIKFEDATYYVPIGYRGIGNPYIDSNVFKLRFNKITGNNAIIDLRMTYQEYDSTSSGENYKGNKNVNGFGLFNFMPHMGASETNCIKDLTISGSIFYDIRRVPDGAKNNYGWGKGNAQYFTPNGNSDNLRIDAETIFSVGGLAGLLGNNTYIKNVEVKNNNFEAAKYLGGLIGYSNDKNITIINPKATNIKLNGGFVVGSLIGMYKTTGSNKKLIITGEDGNHSIININNINQKGRPSYQKIEQKTDTNFSCAGGVVGCIENSNVITLTINNIKVSSGSITSNAGYEVNEARGGTQSGFNYYDGGTGRYERPNDMRYKPCIAGLIGFIKNANCSVSNCTVENVTIEGGMAGGVIGYVRNNVYGSFSNINIITNNSSKIDGTSLAGGFAGIIWLRSAIKLSISSFSVTNYEITSSYNDAEGASSGGVIGYLKFEVWDNNSYLNFGDVLIDNCAIKRLNSKNNLETNIKVGVGGLVGTIEGSNAASFSMDNALVRNVTIETAASNATGYRKPGMLIGTDEQIAVKFVGISLSGGDSRTIPLFGRTKNTANKPWGINTANNNDSYIVFADYNNVIGTENENQENPSLFTSTTDYEKISPFVTVNPSINIGTGQIVTSDGMSQTVDSSPIISILNDGLNSDGTLKPTIPLYDYSKSYLTVFNQYRSHLSTFNRESGSTISNDFMVLVVDDMKKSITTKMINSYLNLLANTNFDYTVDKSKVYSVDIYKMVYNFETSQFEKSDEEANLKSNRNDSGSTAKYFYMLGDGGDSLGTMFSLIDVKFYDPKDSSKIAYHLYVPVFVKKILKYNFTIATGSGTNYDRSWYEDNNRYGAPLLENLGSDITILFNYEYLRDQEEWNSALNNGDNTLNPINKIVTMDAVSSHLPNNAILVLVDINRGGRPYYARAGEAIVGNQLILANFHTVLDDSTSDAFTPLAFNDMLTITASVDEDGNMVICDEANATVKAKIGSSDTYTFFKMADENDSGTKYTISVDIEENLIESYYVSFFTESTTENILYHYTIESPLSFNDINNPSKLNNKESLSSSAHLILGNIFEQTLSVSSLTENEEISLSGNDRLDVSMDATIQIKDTLFSQVEPYLYSEVLDIYQTFLLRLIKNDEEGRSRIIVGNPEISGSYSITSGESNLEDDYDTINKTTNYIEFINGVRLNEYLMNTSGVTISGLFSLVYDDEDTIATQFPYRKNDEDTSVCTTVNGSSNISFGNISASNSKCTVSDDDLSKKYYSKLSNNKAVLYYNVIGDLFIGDYGSLGINPLDFEDMDKSNIYTMASFDISSIIDETYQTVNDERVYLYDYVRLQIRLSSKQDNYDLNEHALTLGDYFVDVWIPGASSETGYSETKSGSTYTFILPRNWTEESVNTNLVIPIYYKVLTGSEFENNGYYYSNYKITLTADLIRYGENDEIVSYSYSTDTDYIIYTNARIYPDFID